MNIPVMTITRSIALIPELIRDSLGYAKWSYAQLMAGNHEDPDMDELLSEGNEPWLPWQSGRRALEILMLIRTHREFPEGHNEAMHSAIEDIDSPQHAMDIVMALASMLNHLASDEDVEAFGRALAEAEARAA